VALRLAGQTEAEITHIIIESARRFGVEAADRYSRLMGSEPSEQANGTIDVE